MKGENRIFKKGFAFQAFEAPEQSIFDKLFDEGVG